MKIKNEEFFWGFLFGWMMFAVTISLYFLIQYLRSSH